ncbi:hypothetical protein PanWU01x14_344880 [Parasponia andersonii]|uniref:Uncharacterized protein n=1 Tax=Parasponia andersonii TaxID=3476 RepID=A0A2P5ACV0_PARAD|nr:hypothetical protein PanWU01x14_344880 [Parasponia andersonii]
MMSLLRPRRSFKTFQTRCIEYRATMLMYTLWCKHPKFEFTLFGDEGPQLIASFITAVEQENRTNEEMVTDQLGIVLVVAERDIENGVGAENDQN